MRKSSEQPLLSEVNIVLLGKTGSGKSASGNTIIGGDRCIFEENFSPASVTSICKLETTEVDRQKINVIDTVGIPDTLQNITDVQTKLEQIFACAHYGIDVFLLVIRLGVKFTEESRKVVEWIHDNFGTNLLRHTIVLFTHGDQLCEPIERYLEKSPILQSVVNQYSGRYHVLDNKSNDQSNDQVNKLLKKINTLREKNRNSKYTEQDYKKTQDEILQRKYLTGAAVGGGAGGAVGAAAGAAIAAKVGEVAVSVGKAAVIGATGGAALVAAAVGFGVYYFARKYICNSESRNKKQN